MAEGWPQGDAFQCPNPGCGQKFSTRKALSKHMASWCTHAIVEGPEAKGKKRAAERKQRQRRDKREKTYEQASVGGEGFAPAKSSLGSEAGTNEEYEEWGNEAAAGEGTQQQLCINNSLTISLHVDMRKGDTSRSVKKRMVEYEDGRNVDGEVGSYGMLKALLDELREKGLEYSSWSPQAFATTALQVREWVEGHRPGQKVWPPATSGSKEQEKSLARRKEFWRTARQMDRIRQEVHDRQASDRMILRITPPKEDLDPFKENSQ